MTPSTKLGRTPGKSGKKTPARKAEAASATPANTKTPRGMKQPAASTTKEVNGAPKTPLAGSFKSRIPVSAKKPKPEPTPSTAQKPGAEPQEHGARTTTSTAPPRIPKPTGAAATTPGAETPNAPTPAPTHPQHTPAQRVHDASIAESMQASRARRRIFREQVRADTEAWFTAVSPAATVEAPAKTPAKTPTKTPAAPPNPEPAFAILIPVRPPSPPVAPPATSVPSKAATAALAADWRRQMLPAEKRELGRLEKRVAELQRLLRGAEAEVARVQVAVKDRLLQKQRAAEKKGREKKTAGAPEKRKRAEETAGDGDGGKAEPAKRVRGKRAVAAAGQSALDIAKAMGSKPKGLGDKPVRAPGNAGGKRQRGPEEEEEGANRGPVRKKMREQPARKAQKACKPRPPWKRV